MKFDYHRFIKDIDKINLEDICSDWQWLLNHEHVPIVVSCSGDAFLAHKTGSISWLDTGIGKLTKVADNTDSFFEALEDSDNSDLWLLASVVSDLIDTGVTLAENEVYSYKIMPVLGGDYSVANFEATDISVHFSMTGQICKQVAAMPDDID